MAKNQVKRRFNFPFLLFFYIKWSNPYRVNSNFHIAFYLSFIHEALSENKYQVNREGRKCLNHSSGDKTTNSELF